MKIFLSPLSFLLPINDMTNRSQFSASELTPIWRILLPLLIQTGLILAIPAQVVYTLITGKTVILQTAPVDPYDFLRGFSQTLSYDISSQNNLRNLPGWQEVVKQQNIQKSGDKSAKYLPEGANFYLILEAPNSSQSMPPKPWKAVKITSDRPTLLPANQIALKGKSTWRTIEYGLETYYMPGNRRDEINQDINQARWGKQRQPIVVEVKIDSSGRAIPVSFWISDRHYQF